MTILEWWKGQQPHHAITDQMWYFAEKVWDAATLAERERIIRLFPIPDRVDSSDPYTRGRLDQAVADAAAIRSGKEAADGK